MPPAGLPERIWKTDDLQRIDDLLSARNGRTEVERAKYLRDMQALDDPERHPEEFAALKKKYPPPWPDVVGPGLAISRDHGIFGDKNSDDARLTEEHLRQDWYTSKNAKPDQQTGKTGWWSHDLRVGDLLRKSIIQAGMLAIEKGLPVDSYWVSTGSDTGGTYSETPLQCFVTWNPQQIMLFILTPALPIPYSFGPPTRPERLALQITCTPERFVSQSAIAERPLTDNEMQAMAGDPGRRDELLRTPQGRQVLLGSAPGRDALLNTPEGRRLLLSTDEGRDLLATRREGRVMLLNSPEVRQFLAGTTQGPQVSGGTSQGARLLASTNELTQIRSPEGRQELALTPNYGMTIVGADVYGDVLAWPTRANASYWLKDQFNPSRLPPPDDDEG